MRWHYWHSIGKVLHNSSHSLLPICKILHIVPHFQQNSLEIRLNYFWFYFCSSTGFADSFTICELYFTFLDMKLIARLHFIYMLMDTFVYYKCLYHKYMYFFAVGGIWKPHNPNVSTFNAAFQVVQWIKWHKGLVFCLSVAFELGKFHIRVSNLYFQTDTFSILEPPFFYFI